MASDALRPKLDQEEFSVSADQLVSFYGALPKNAVRDLALEGFRRLAARKKEQLNAPHSDAVHDSIESLCHALISPDNSASAREGDLLLSKSASVEQFYLLYLSGAAKRLGEWWDQDQVSFFDVTVGLGRLHALVRALEQPSTTLRATKTAQKRAIFATVPCERHTLGVTMATDIFRRRGWHILLLVGLGHDELLDRIAEADASVLGVSAGGAHAAAQLARLMLDLRVVRPDCRVFVSGRIVTEARDLVEKAIPDGIAASVEEAEALLCQFSTDDTNASATAES